MTNITLISGGALGADSVWSYIAEKYGIKTIHLIGSGLSRPTGGIDDNRIREQRSGINQAITYEQTANSALESSYIHSFYNILQKCQVNIYKII